mmetsp:Transcript_13263/g.38601  ORF Transcript_13263/g.38601 Transcript_13263/m.38601 type:complete len:207 (-) Transcript_13263:319-939(-)
MFHARVTIAATRRDSRVSASTDRYQAADGNAIPRDSLLRTEASRVRWSSSSSFFRLFLCLALQPSSSTQWESCDRGHRSSAFITPSPSSSLSSVESWHPSPSKSVFGLLRQPISPAAQRSSESTTPSLSLSRSCDDRSWQPSRSWSVALPLLQPLPPSCSTQKSCMSGTPSLSRSRTPPNPSPNFDTRTASQGLPVAVGDMKKTEW